MSVTFEQIKPIVYALGPTIALTYLPRLYRLLFTASPIPPKPLPAHVNRVLNYLFAPILLFLLLSFPNFAPEDIYKVTKTKHFLAPTADIFDKLSDLRSPFAETDFSLKAKFAKKECRTIYPVYGPDALANCPYCHCDDPSSYFSYVVTSVLLPHLLNAVVLGLVTGLAGREGARWRTTSTILSALIAGVDLWRLWSFDVKENGQMIYVSGVEFLHWKLRTQRFASLFLLDSMMYLLLWSTATHRFLAQPPDISERLEDVTKGQEMILQSLTSLVGARNTVFRDPALRKATNDYWMEEEEVMQEVFEQPDVVDGLRDALSRAPIEDITRFAGQASGAFVAQMNGIRQRRAGASAAP